MRKVKLGWIVVSAVGSCALTLWFARQDWKRVQAEYRQVR